LPKEFILIYTLGPGMIKTIPKIIVRKCWLRTRKTSTTKT